MAAILDLVVIKRLFGELSAFPYRLAFGRLLLAALQLLLLFLRFGTIAVAAFLFVVRFEGHLLSLRRACAGCSLDRLFLS